MRISIILRNILNLYMVSYIIYKSQLFYTYKFLLITKYLPSIFAAFLMLFSFFIFFKNKSHNPILSKLNFFYAAIIILIFLFLFNSELTFLNLFLNLRVPLIILSVFSIYNYLDVKLISSLRKSFFFFLILNGLVSLAYNIDLFSYFENSNRLRLSFGFVKPSYFCELIFINLILIYIDFNYNQNSKKSIAFIQTLILFFFIYLSNTRAAFITILVFSFLYLFKRAKRLKKFALIIFSLIFVISLGNLSYDFFTSYDSGRLLIWANNLSLNLKTSNDYIFGTGYGNAVSFVDLNNLRYNEDIGSQFHSDSFYIDTIVQQGFLGLFYILYYYIS